MHLILGFLIWTAQAAPTPVQDCTANLQLSAEAQGKFKIGTKYKVSPQEQTFVREDGAQVKVRLQNTGNKKCWRNYLCHHHYNYSLYGSKLNVKPPFKIYSPECKEAKAKERDIGAHGAIEENLTIALDKNIKPGKYWVQLKFFGNPPLGDRTAKTYTLSSVPFEIEVVR